MFFFAKKDGLGAFVVFLSQKRYHLEHIVKSPALFRYHSSSRP